eukprot:5116721-Alexandrium_andersonii.AAC.1
MVMMMVMMVMMMMMVMMVMMMVLVMMVCQGYTPGVVTTATLRKGSTSLPKDLMGHSPSQP